MSGKNNPRMNANVKSQEEGDGSNKPLGATILAEFQSLKDKFKNEDDGFEKGTQVLLLIWNDCLMPFYSSLLFRITLSTS
jgi:hypothetical protein